MTPGHASLSGKRKNAIEETINNTNIRNFSALKDLLTSIRESKWYLDNNCSLNIGTISSDEKSIDMSLELRYAFQTLKNKEQIIDILKTQFQQFNVDIVNIASPKVFDKDIVNYLLREYNDFNKINLNEEVSGYITYAHSLPFAVPCGPFTNDNDSAHGFDEYIVENEFKNNIEFYTRTLVKKIIR